MSQRFRRALSLIGPYPYNPYLIFLLFLAIMVSRFMPIAYEVPAGPERHTATAILAVMSLVPPTFLQVWLCFTLNFAFGATKAFFCTLWKFPWPVHSYLFTFLASSHSCAITMDMNFEPRLQLQPLCLSRP